MSSKVYRRIIIIALTFFAVICGSWYYKVYELKEEGKKEVSQLPETREGLYPGGMPIGLYMETDGVLILDTEQIHDVENVPRNPAEHLVKEGDYIVGLNGKSISSKKELIREIEELQDKKVKLTLRRQGEKIDISFSCIEYETRKYKLGLWVRDNAQGIGTITYLKYDNSFGALGHGINDLDTGDLIEISRGKVYATTIKGVQKGEKGVPGGMEGIIVYNNHNLLGIIDDNKQSGIYGTIERSGTLFRDLIPMEAADEKEIKIGKAVIRSAIAGDIREYDINITSIIDNEREINKGLTIEITDSSLIEATGGIVQGMSGSPIIQEGKIVGAVTHVFVNEPTKGYGIKIGDMLREE